MLNCYFWHLVNADVVEESGLKCSENCFHLCKSQLSHKEHHRVTVQHNGVKYGARDLTWKK